jgi:trehalose 6-phosphate phosphatase
MAEEELLERFARSHPRGIFLDFDGTLSDIVSRPELAQPLPGTRSLLAELARRNELVAMVSGRPSADLNRLLDMADLTGVEAFGQYGIESHRAGALGSEEVRAEVSRAAQEVEGVWVEDKEASLALHYRAAPDPAGAEERLRRSLEAIAEHHGLVLLRGKMVLELAPGDTPGKGSVVLRLARARGLAGCLFAGDDRADLAAFRALDELRVEGLVTVKVAVRSEETPSELLESADVIAERPSGLLAMLGRL